MACYNAERKELHKTIWKIANSVRGAIDGWEFKCYVLGSLFYRFISEYITAYINGQSGGQGVMRDFAAAADADAETVRDTVVRQKGFFILPSQLFCNVCRHADQDENLNETLSGIFCAIESSAAGTPSEDSLKGLFSDFRVDSYKLGRSVRSRNRLLAKMLVAVRDMDFGRPFEDNDIDAFGDAYEFLMQMYASEAGKSGGEFFTPPEVSELLARIAAHGISNLRKVYDPACGSGSLLLKFAKTVGRRHRELRYYGQDINPTTYNLCRINMFLHDIPYTHFDIRLGDTLHEPLHLHEAPFDAIVSNPPYSLKWDGKENPDLLHDVRYAPAGVLAKNAADIAFTMHILYHLAECGTAAVVELPGLMYRGGDEQRIRKYLIDNNYVDTVIQLPVNLFFGVGIATCIIVLRKRARPDRSVLFIDASHEFTKEGRKNKLYQTHRDRIFSAFAERRDIRYFCRLVRNDDIAINDYNLSVSNYIEQEEKREEIVIDSLNEQIAGLVARGNALRRQVDEVITQLHNQNT